MRVVIRCRSSTSGSRAARTGSPGADNGTLLTRQHETEAAKDTEIVVGWSGGIRWRLGVK